MDSHLPPGHPPVATPKVGVLLLNLGIYSYVAWRWRRPSPRWRG